MNSQLPRSIDSDLPSETSALPGVAILVSILALATAGLALYLTLTRDEAPTAAPSERVQAQNAEKIAREALEQAKRNAAEIETLQREFLALRRSTQDGFNHVANTLREIRAELTRRTGGAEAPVNDTPIRGS